MVQLDVTGALRVEKVLPKPGPDGVLVLAAELADIHNPGYGEHARVETRYGAPNIGYWHDARAWLERHGLIDGAGGPTFKLRKT